MMRYILIWTLGLCAALLVSCSGDTCYSESREVSPDGWNMDSVLRFPVMFTPEILDETDDFRVNLMVRNDDGYAWQNLWLFIGRMGADSVAVRDTVEIFLSDNSGRWIGSGVGSLHTLSEVYIDTLHVDRPGEYLFEVRHGMRMENLDGICNIGLSVEKIAHQ